MGDLKIPIAVYEKEPSSVIAFTLSSREYTRELIRLQSMDKGKKKSFITSKKAEEFGLTLTETTAAATSATTCSTSSITDVDSAGGTILYVITYYS